MKLVKYLCFVVVLGTLAVVVWKWSAHVPGSQPLSPETVRLIRDKLTESCNLVSDNNYDQARRVLEDVLRLDPNQSLALYDLSVLANREGNLTNSHDLLVKALKHADQAKVKKTAVFIISRGVLTVFLPEDGDDSGLKHNPKEASGGQVFYANGESFVRELENAPNLKLCIQNELKGPSDETEKNTAQTDKAMRTALYECGALVLCACVFGGWKWRSVRKIKSKMNPKAPMV
jgi:hypothetical protein